MAHFVISSHLVSTGMRARGLARLHPSAVPYVHFGLYRERGIELSPVPDAALDVGYVQMCNGRWVCKAPRNESSEAGLQSRWNATQDLFESHWVHMKLRGMVTSVGAAPPVSVEATPSLHRRRSLEAVKRARASRMESATRAVRTRAATNSTSRRSDHSTVFERRAHQQLARQHRSVLKASPTTNQAPPQLYNEASAAMSTPSPSPRGKMSNEKACEHHKTPERRRYCLRALLCGSRLRGMTLKCESKE